MMFPNHSLGRNILGTPESLSSYNRQNLLTFLNNNYFTDQMVLSFVGNLEEKDLIKIFEKYFGSEKLKMSNNKVTRKPKYQKFYLEERKKTFQTHCIIGASAYGFKSKKRIGLHLLNNVLGGPGMNSRLNMSLRERNGCSYNIESNYTAYSDTGIFEVYFGTDKENLEKCLKLVHQEFEILKNKKMGDIQFTKAKKQLMGQLAIASDHNENIMQSIGKSFLVFNKVDSLEEINKQIETISQQHFMDVANEILDTKNLSTLLFK